MKKLTLLLTFLCSLVQAAPQPDCQSELLIAHYQINRHQANNKTKTLDQTLVRQNNQLVQLFSSQQYGDSWLKLPNGQLMLTRFFPSAKRAIEYQAEDIKANTLGEDFWQQKWQLISPALLNKMTVTQQTGEGCQQVEHRKWQYQNKSYELRWLPKLQLIKTLEVSVNNQLIESWQLINVENELEKVKAFIAPISNYQSTDYADIGDNEADPFFAKMITQGFHTPSETSSHLHHH